MANYIDNSIERVKRVFGGEFTEEEEANLRRIQNIFQQVIESHSGFNESVKETVRILKEIVQSEFDERKRENTDMLSFLRTCSQNKSLISNNGKNLTKKEEEFSKDIIAAIDFVIRNGIGYGLIINVLCHDMKEILIVGELDNADYSPKVSGWAQYDVENIGDPEEPEM